LEYLGGPRSTPDDDFADRKLFNDLPAVFKVLQKIGLADLLKLFVARAKK
jgi:hypothetical protein